MIITCIFNITTYSKPNSKKILIFYHVFTNLSDFYLKYLCSSLSDSHTNVNDHVYECSYKAWFKTCGRKGCWKGKWRWCHHIIVAIRYDPVLEQQVPHIRPQTTFRYIKWLKGNHEVFNNLPNLYLLYIFIMEYYTTLYIMMMFFVQKVEGAKYITLNVYKHN